MIPGLLIACLLATGGCDSSSRLDRHPNRAEKHHAGERHESAVIEYLNALRLDPVNPVALRGLALTYAAAGNYEASIPAMLAAAEALPEDIELQTNAGTLYLLAGRYAQARQAAERIIATEPDTLTGYLILADAARSADEVAEALTRLDERNTLFADQAAFHTARAELLLRADRLDEADAALRRAIVIDPDVARIQMAYGRLKRAGGDIEAATEAFMRASDLAPEDPVIQIGVAQFKRQQGDTNAARTILEATVSRHPDTFAALIELARLEVSARQFEAAMQHLDAIETIAPDHPDVRHLRATIKLATGRAVEARALLEALVRIKPNDPRVHFDLALARVADQDPTKAIEALDRAVGLAPGFVQARLVRAETRIRNGLATDALYDLRALLDEDPTLDRARLLMAAAYRAGGRHAAATGVYRALLERTPGSGHLHYLLAASLLAEGETDNAQAQLERALHLTPEHLSALNLITELDLRRNRSDAALARIDQHLARSPDAVPLLYLRGLVLYSAQDLEAAERAFRRVIERDARMLDAYVMLGRLLSAMGRTDEAIEKLDTVIASSPGNPGPLMLSAVLENSRGNRPGAMARYEQTLDAAPDFHPALNNLAYLLAEDDTQLERAHALAMQARQAAPENPFVADTLGWIAYRRGDYRWANAMLREAAASLSDYPDVHYHLGMAQAMLGLEAEAAASLTRALDAASDFDGKETAAALLAVLAIDPDADASALTPTLETLLDRLPAHPSALLRRAALAARTDKATDDQMAEFIATAERLLARYPLFLPVAQTLAQTYLARRENLPRAWLLAREVREARPDDPATARLLGQLAHLRDEHAYAATLLESAVQAGEDDVESLYMLGLSLQRAGREAEAIPVLQRALAAAPDAPQSPAALAIIGTAPHSD